MWRNWWRSPGFQQRFVEQTDETPDISIAEKIVERLVTQMQGKTQQVVNTRVQTMEVSLLQSIVKVVDIPVVAMRQTHSFQKTIEIPQMQVADKVSDVLLRLSCWSHRCKSWRRQLRSRSCRSMRKSSRVWTHVC